MTTRTQNSSIKNKLSNIVLVCMFIAIVLSSIALSYAELMNNKHRTANALKAEANVVGSMSDAALEFGDEGKVIENLRAFGASKEVQIACIFPSDDTILTGNSYAYRREDITIDCKELPSLIHESQRSLTQRYFSAGTIISNNIARSNSSESLGTIIIKSDGAVVKPLLYRFVLASIIIQSIAVFVVYLLSRALLNRALAPILSLAASARSIQSSKDFTRRARVFNTNDEVDHLVHDFNGLISTVQNRETQLIDANLNLETRVSERTQDLEAARKEAESASIAKTMFLANMSHELRTPLATIKGYQELLTYDINLTENQRQKLEIIGQSGDHLVELIDEVLDFSKIEAGQITLDEKIFCLRDPIEDALSMTAHRAATKNLEIGYTMSSSDPDLVIGDEIRLRQILLNLLSNAVKFTDQGVVFVDIQSTEIKKASAETLPVFLYTIVVSDTGIGIPDDKLDQLFKPFKQIDASSTRQHGGTGLGLALCKSIVTEMKGSISVMSRVGIGSRFTVKLPLQADCESINHAARELKETNRKADRRGMIIGNGFESWSIINRTLMDYGLSTLCALPDQIISCPQLTDQKLDIILIENTVSEYYRHQLVDIFHQRLPQIPIVLSHDIESTGKLRDYIRSGESTYLLQKPYQSATVLHILVKAFEHAQTSAYSDKSIRNVNND